MTLVKGIVIGFLAVCALALAGCSSITDMSVKASVRSDAKKQDAERLARGINGVTGVHNELAVGRVSS